MTDYGPQSPHVEALLAQVRAMTPEQVRVARDAWRSSAGRWDDPRYAAVEALIALLGSNLANATGWDAAPLGAQVASDDAFLALVARDLWDQAAYDLLTRPLRRAGITVHPDDPPLEEK